MNLRKDLQQIAAWIPPHARVLDLGCGDGSLLAHLISKGASGYGVEIDINNVITCVEKGVDVLQGDLEAGLAGFSDQTFDVVVLSQTIQAMKHVEQIMLDMLRVGREVIVSFPNFGYWQNRWQIFQGHMPVSETIPYAWYNTPNLHLCMLQDFESFCAKQGIRVVERVVMDGTRRIAFLPNLRGSLAFYRVTRGT
jgi:methionine biosynthesis protein MetW